MNMIRETRWIRIPSAILLPFVLIASAGAQDGANSPESDEETAGDVATSDEAAASNGAAFDQWNRLIYVPFQELRKVFDNENATAIIPYAEYRELLKSYLEKQSADAPAAIITRADYSATIEEDVARVSLQMNVTVLNAEGWARLPLAFGDVAVGKVTSDDDPRTILRGCGEGHYELLFQGAGERTVTLELLAAVSTSPEARAFELKCPAVGISEITVTIPEGDQTVKIAPVEVLLPQNNSDAAKTVVTAALGSTEQFCVSWFPKAGSRPDMDLLTSVSNESTVRIEPQLIQTTSTFTWEVLRGELRDIVVLVPKDARIIDVAAQSGRLESWDAEEMENDQRIRMTLLNPVSDQFIVEVETERIPAGQTMQLLGRDEAGLLHGVHADGAVREAGRLSVSTDASLTLIPQRQSGIKRVSVENADGPAWEFSGDRGVLVVQTRPVEPRLLAQQKSDVIFSDDEVRLQTHLDYTVERAGVFELRLKYPESLTIDQVRADGMSEFSLDKAGGMITLALTNRRMGSIGVDIRGHQAFDASADSVETQIPSVEPLDVERSEGTVSLHAPQFLDVVTIDDQRTGLTPLRGASSQVSPRTRQVSAWNFTQQPWTLSVRTSQRPAQVDAIVATTAQVDPEIVRFTSSVTFHVRNAGIDTFRLAVPEAVADDVRFQAVNSAHVIRQSGKADEAEDGWVAWTLVLQDEVTGAVGFSADWEVPLEDAADDAERTVSVEPVRVVSPVPDDGGQQRRVMLTQVRGEMRLMRHDSLSIDADASGETTEAIDVRELEYLPRDGYLAFRYFEQPAAATVKIRQHDIHDVVATVVSRAAIEIVTEKQTQASYRCRYRITSSERQRLRIDVPTGAELHTPLMNGQRTTFEPVDGEDPAADEESEMNWDTYYVNVSRTGESDETFLLSIQFRSPIVEADRFPYEGMGGKQLLRIPVIGDSSGSTVVQETRLTVWTPKDISIFGEPDRWSRIGRQTWSFWRPLESPNAAQADQTLSGWIGENSASDFARQGHAVQFRALGNEPMNQVIEASWWNWPFLVAVISGTLALIGLVLRRTSWENRITLVLLAAVAMTVWALNDRSEVFHLVSAGSIGLFAVAGLWLTGLLLGQARGSTAEPSDSLPPPDLSRRSPTSPSPEPVSGPPGTVTPPPGLKDTMDKLMGGKR